MVHLTTARASERLAAAAAFIRSRRLRRWGGKVVQGLVVVAALMGGIFTCLQLSDRLQPATPEVEATATPPIRVVSPVPTDAHAAAEMVVFNVESKKYHCPTCHSALACTVHCIRITLAEAVKRNGIPCKTCGGRCR